MLCCDVLCCQLVCVMTEPKVQCAFENYSNWKLSQGVSLNIDQCNEAVDS